MPWEWERDARTHIAIERILEIKIEIEFKNGNYKKNPLF
jgi:hypothetical protein